MVVADSYRVFVGETVTGRITADLPAESIKWGVRLNDAGLVEATVRADALELAQSDIAAATAPKRMFLGIDFGGTILEAGPIWKRKYNWETGTLTVTGAGIWSLLDKVKALNWAQILTGTAVTRTAIDLTNLTLASIAREFVRIPIQTNPSNPGLPIVLPALVAGTSERHVKGYELQWVGDLLRNLTKVDSGPDIAFRPRYSATDATKVEWPMVTGTDADPLLHQTGADWIWDPAVDQSGVVMLDTEEDASKMADQVWQPGAGSELTMKLATAADTTLITTAGYPWTEGDVAMKDVEDLTVLQGHANAGLTKAKRPVSPWGVTVRADVAPALGSYSPGDFAQLNIPRGHPLIGQGMQRVRIMAVDGDGSLEATITPAPIVSTLGATAYGASRIEGGVRADL
ncbi:hypothetical protein SPF06_07020 [Sinomonas sp. JGH33]|uniref:Minor tail protein n=1 Tax=Sinomonas terricola TaxID=3110330 RepID=A0ABU5T473_9MICC|nr:hypothetical protein [Sinomonas sp. JGH33]MEA5454468.1 hypothetical protein [Sinomonas sp. JGH33]